jgi:hypothetical protein
MKVSFELDEDDNADLLNSLFSDAMSNCLRMKLTELKKDESDPLRQRMLDYYEEKIKFYEKLGNRLKMETTNEN